MTVSDDDKPPTSIDVDGHKMPVKPCPVCKGFGVLINDVTLTVCRFDHGPDHGKDKVETTKAGAVCPTCHGRRVLGIAGGGS